MFLSWNILLLLSTRNRWKKIENSEVWALAGEVQNVLKPLATACVPFCSPSETTPTFLKQMSVPVTDTFDCTSCAGYGNYQLQSCCANLGSTQTSCLDCGTCSRGYAADTFPYGYSSHSFLCLLYFFFFFLLLLDQGVFEVLQMAPPQQAAFSIFSFSTFLWYFSYACMCKREHLCLLVRIRSSSSSTHEIFIG